MNEFNQNISLIEKNNSFLHGNQLDSPRLIKKELEKDDFLKMMLTQLQCQDPTQPFKTEQMATELAQLASLEQLQNMNQTLGQLYKRDDFLEKMTMLSMIDKWVTFDQRKFFHQEGQMQELRLNLLQDAAQLKLTIVNEEGEKISEYSLRNQKKGEVKFFWDGKTNDGVCVKGGNYLMRLTTQVGEDNWMEISSQIKSRILGVNFKGDHPEFILDPKNSPISSVPLKEVMQIEAFNQDEFMIQEEKEYL